MIPVTARRWPKFASLTLATCRSTVRGHLEVEREPAPLSDGFPNQLPYAKHEPAVRSRLSSNVLLNAVEVGVFTKLGKRLSSGAELATELGLYPRGISHFFDSFDGDQSAVQRPGIVGRADEVHLLLQIRVVENHTHGDDVRFGQRVFKEISGDRNTASGSSGLLREADRLDPFVSERPASVLDRKDELHSRRCPGSAIAQRGLSRFQCICCTSQFWDLYFLLLPPSLLTKSVTESSTPYMGLTVRVEERTVVVVPPVVV